jgi:hypothetical protein
MIGLYPGLYPFITPIGTPVLPINRSTYTQPTSKSNKIDIEIKKKTTTSSGKNADLQDLKNKINDLNKIYNVIFRHICMKKQNFLHDMYTGVDSDLRKQFSEYDSKDFCLGDMAPLENPPTAPTPVAQQALTAAQKVKDACDAVKVQIDIIVGGVAGGAGGAVVAAQTLLAPGGTTRQQVDVALVFAQQAIAAAAAVAAVAAGGLTLQQAKDAELAAHKAQAEAQRAQAACASAASAATAAAAQAQINAAVIAAQVAAAAAQAAVALVPAGTKGTCTEPMFEKARLNALIDSFYNNNYIHKTCAFRDANGNYPVNVTIKQAGGSENKTQNYIDLLYILKNKPLQNNVYENKNDINMHNFGEKWTQDRNMFRNVLIDMLLIDDVNKQLPLMSSSAHLVPSVLLNKKEYNNFFQLYNDFKNSKNRK